MPKNETHIHREFTPKDFFMAPYEWIETGYKATVAIGNVVVRLNELSDPIDQKLLSKIDADIDAHFDAWQMLTNKTYKMESSRVRQYDSNGTLQTIVYAKAVITGGRAFAMAWVTITDAQGNVTDTRQEYINKNVNLLKQIEKYYENDSILRPMINSYNSSFRDENNSLIHIYEVRDRIVTRFKNAKKAKAAIFLNQNDKRWNEFGDICNVRPIKQGRHRGKHLSDLRDVTESEMDFVRKFAHELITRYINYVAANYVDG